MQSPQLLTCAVSTAVFQKGLFHHLSWVCTLCHLGSYFMWMAWNNQQLVPSLSVNEVTATSVFFFILFLVSWSLFFACSRASPSWILSERFPTFTSQAQLPFISLTPQVDGHTPQLSVFEGRAEQEQQLLAAPKENLRQMPRFMSPGIAGLTSAQKRLQKTLVLFSMWNSSVAAWISPETQCVSVSH